MLGRTFAQTRNLPLVRLPSPYGKQSMSRFLNDAAGFLLGARGAVGPKIALRVNPK